MLDCDWSSDVCSSDLIEADQGGVIKAILVENGQPVEYGEPLFIIG
jgi:biotin carboxyl carrier protein